MGGYPREETWSMSEPVPTATNALGRERAGTDLFERIVCGIDETAESLEAVRQATRLRAPDGNIVLLIADEAPDDIAGRGGVGERELERDLRAVLSRAAELAPDAERRLVTGPAVAALLEAAEAATVVVLGTHGLSRAVAVTIGSVGYRVLHDAPCSVFVARPPLFPAAFPASIAVGIDGSPASFAAAEEGRKLAERFGAEIRFVCGSGDNVDVERAREAFPELIRDDRDPVDALVAAAAEVDILVLGSRGLHGLRSLGSVSERVAHKAPSSVLVVRPAQAAERGETDG
jgi:nucleotide-binding universal stress UspA family protein